MTDFCYQLYSSRNHGPLPETLKMLADAGYAGVEGYGGLYDSLDEAALIAFRKELDANRLAMPTAHFGLNMLEDDPARVVITAKALRIKTIYCPFLPAEARPDSTGGWADFGRRLNRASEPILDAGIGFGWHNHDFEFKPLPDGSMPIEHIFGGGPNLEWEADVAWVARAGADPFKWIDNYADRITAVHVKDIAAEGENADEDGWADVGYGILPWKALMERLVTTSARHFIMEHDKPRDDARFARRSIETASKYRGQE